MGTPLRVAAFVAALVAAFAVSWGAGRVVGPIDTEPVAHQEMADHGGAHPEEEHLPGGLSVSSDGYSLVLADDRVAAGPRAVVFTITGPDGQPLTDYELAHEKPLHLIAVRRDFEGYQHVHPSMSPDGAWTTDLTLSPGVWRVFADFVPHGGDDLTPGTDLVVPGRGSTTAAAPERRTSVVGDYSVELVGDLGAGTSSPVEVRVSRDGRPVTDLQPYLGAYGHLVALRETDLAYLHVHPEDGDAGPDVPFVAEVPSAGRYRLFFDFKHAGRVRTASFVVTAGGSDDH
jgi:hypothetical protein